MSYDDDYYNGHLEPLLTDTDLYNVDPYLFSLKDRTAVNTALNSDKYFKSITDIRFISEKKPEVLARAAQDVDNFNFGTAANVGENGTGRVGTFEPLKGAATEEFASIVITRGAESISPSDCLTTMNDVVKVAPDLEKRHDLMHTFLHDIVMSVGRVHFFKVIELMKNDRSLQISRQANFWNESRYTLVYSRPARLDLLLDTTSQTANDILCTYVRTKIQKNLDFNNKSTTTQEQRKYIYTNLMEDLQIDKFKGPLYYNLRTELTKQLKFSTQILNNENTNVQLYFKQIVADIYIKTCYPVIIFNYINCMMNMYIEYGDFVNSRIALLAKVMYAYYFFVNITSNYGTTGRTPVLDSTVETYLSKIQFYLQNVNNIDMQANNTNMMRSIVKDLHKQSSVVVDKSKEIQMLKDQIKNNQLAYRNVIYNTDVSKKFYKAKITENIVLIVILVSLIIVCSALLVLNNESNKLNLYVTYISGGFALIILMYQIFKMLSKVVGK